jgi:hypothetical protein
MNELDYSFIRQGRRHLLHAKRAADKSALQLIAKAESEVIHTLLSSVDGKVVSFDQRWKPEQSGARRCPEYSSSPGPDEQPRKVVMSAMEILGTPTMLSGIDIEGSGGAMPRREAKVLGRQQIHDEEQGVLNRGCPDNMGYKRTSYGRIRSLYF